VKSLFLNDSVVLYHIVQENRDLFTSSTTKSAMNTDAADVESSAKSDPSL